MGVEHYVVDKRNKRMFWLGKGNWYTLKEFLRPEIGIWALIEGIREAWKNTYAVHDPVEDPVWTRRMGIELLAFCRVAGWDVEFRSDTHDYDDEYSGVGNVYRLVKSRYIDEKTEEDPCAEVQEAEEILLSKWLEV